MRTTEWFFVVHSWFLSLFYLSSIFWIHNLYEYWDPKLHCDIKPLIFGILNWNANGGHTLRFTAGNVGFGLCDWVSTFLLAGWWIPKRFCLGIGCCSLLERGASLLQELLASSNLLLILTILKVRLATFRKLGDVRRFSLMISL